ncbi:MAG: toxic anion resistance protein [Candidatus Limivivens sp.]|nr:toxic anion resistance protein [Candidatus Limivivens sp.]
MSEEFKDFEAIPTPTLTLDPFGTPQTKEQPAVIQEETKPEVPVFEESNLTPEERKMVDEFAKQIDLTNSGMILQYGVGAQKKMADFSESALENVKTKDLGEVGDMLSDVVTELKSFDAEEESKGILGFFRKGNDKLANMKAKYAKAETNVNQICEALEKHQVVLMKDIAVLDKMYDLNQSYFKEISMYILAGKKKLAQVRAEELPVLMNKAAASGLPEDAQAVKDLDSLCNRFEKKIHDLELTRMISLQTAPQIRLVQSNDTQMVEKIQSTIVNTIPLWKSQMVLALGVAHSNEAAKAQRQVTDMTNELLKKNAETLKMASIETAKESERGVVDIETLKQTNTTLISTLDEVLKIQKEGHQKRMAAEAEMQRIEGEMKAKLLEMSAR